MLTLAPSSRSLATRGLALTATHTLLSCCASAVEGGGDALGTAAAGKVPLLALGEHPGSITIMLLPVLQVKLQWGN